MDRPAIFLSIPLLEERHKRSILSSLALHVGFFVFIVVGSYLIPRGATIVIGTGPGGGRNGESMTVGLVDELAGGTGMTKPSLIPQPPADVSEKPAVEQPKNEAIELPRIVDPKQQKLKAPEKMRSRKNLRRSPPT